MKRNLKLVIMASTVLFILTACSKKPVDDVIVEVAGSNEEINDIIEEDTDTKDNETKDEKSTGSILGYSVDEYINFLDNIDVQLAGDPYYMKGIGQNTSRNYYIPVVFDINTITNDFIDLIDMDIQINDVIIRDVEYERFGDIWLLYFNMQESSIENIKLIIMLQEDLQDDCNISREYPISKLIDPSQLVWAPENTLNNNMLTKLDNNIIVSPSLSINEYQTTIKNETVKAYEIVFKLHGFGSEYSGLNISKQCDINIVNIETYNTVELPNTENGLQNGQICFRGEYTSDKEITLNFYTLMEANSIESIESAKRLITDFFADNLLAVNYKGVTYYARLNGADID